MTASPRQLRSAAEAIASVRLTRNGGGPMKVANIWDHLTPTVRAEVLEDAEAALAAAGAEEDGLEMAEFVDAIVAERNARVLEAAGDQQAPFAREHANRLIQEAWEKIDSHWNRF